MLCRTYARPTISKLMLTYKTMKEVPRKKAAAKKERLRFKAEWEWLYQKRNVKTGMKPGVTT